MLMFLSLQSETWLEDQEWTRKTWSVGEISRVMHLCMIGVSMALCIWNFTFVNYYQTPQKFKMYK